jgi:membrane-bound lytic murein transglycosylase D
MRLMRWLLKGALLIVLISGCAARRGPMPQRTPVAPPEAVDLSVIAEAAPPPVVPHGSALEVSRAQISEAMLDIVGDSAAMAVKADVTDFDISSDLEVLAFASHERVNFFTDSFTGTARDRILSYLSAGTRYEPMIRAKLRAASLPEDLYYLALIESGYNPDAYSSAAAVGVWQFMTATAKGEGLKVDWWVDERRDPTLATEAAVRHLNRLRNQFGSLFLAAAAYNGGSGMVQRGLVRHAEVVNAAEGEAAFFALAETNYLRAETRDYVPRLIAATLVAKSAARMDMAFDTLPPVEFDSVRVGPSLPLAAVAAAVHSDVAEIRSLNNHVLRGVTHPKDSMWVRVPAGSAVQFAAGLATVNSDIKEPWTRTRSKSGETFAAVAKRVGMTSKQLSWYNPRDGASRRVLPAGTTILVPSREVLAGAKDVPDPSIEIYGGAGSRYLVKRGDTLSGIAARFRTSVASIKRLNGLRGDVIRAGQTLRVR